MYNKINVYCQKKCLVKHRQANVHGTLTTEMFSEVTITNVMYRASKSRYDKLCCVHT